MEKVTLYASMKWFEPAEQPENENIPDSLKKAKDLWEEDKEKNSAEIFGILHKFVKARFLAEELSGTTDIFEIDECLYGEVPMKSIRVVGVDFQGGGPIPSVKAEAIFELKPSGDFSSEEFSAWQEDNELTDGVSFYWEFSDREDEELDLTFGDHQGCECVVVEKAPF